MSETANNPLGAKAVDDPRRTFESAIAQIQQPERPSSQTPIFDRKRGPAAEKQAVTDAARALARLWKVSPALVR